jgi:hypothetical protein
MKNLNLSILTVLLSCFTLFSCHETIEPKSERNYTIIKSDDDNWTTSARIECDSFNFVTENHIEFYVDGRKSNLKGGLIKVFGN